MSKGVPPSGSGCQPSASAASCTASSRSGIPNAVDLLRKNADSLHEWLSSFDEHVRQASDPLFGRGYGLEEKVFDLFQITGRLAASIGQGLRDAAQAIEAFGQDPKGLDAEHESAVPEGNAPQRSQS